MGDPLLAGACAPGWVVAEVPGPCAPRFVVQAPQYTLASLCVHGSVRSSRQQSCNLMAIVKTHHAGGNCESVAYVTVLWRELMSFSSSVADLAFQNAGSYSSKGSRLRSLKLVGA